MLHTSDNPSNPFFIEGIWFVSDSQGIDRTSSFQLARCIYTSFSRIDHLDYVPQYKRLLQKYERRIWNLSWEEIGKITDGCRQWPEVGIGERGSTAPSSRTNGLERNKISPWMLSIPRKPITGYICNRVWLRSLGLRLDS